MTTSTTSTKSTTSHRFPRIVFAIAGIYGLIVMIPQYWLEDRIGVDSPPAITHPEYFYGFIGVVVAWQLVFLLIARDPERYRAIMPIAFIEKIAFGIPVLVLYSAHRVTTSVLGFGLLDLVWALLFAISYLVSNPRRAGTA
ncbi:MAG TPA: hypothetical protein VFK04_07785 [Gemmatimonadaceae bacterium]|nr:hypothetical protein [Gemmatimonadaceae bacterium]